MASGQDVGDPERRFDPECDRVAPMLSSWRIPDDREENEPARLHLVETLQTLTRSRVDRASTGASATGERIAEPEIPAAWRSGTSRWVRCRRIERARLIPYPSGSLVAGPNRISSAAVRRHGDRSIG